MLLLAGGQFIVFTRHTDPPKLPLQVRAPEAPRKQNHRPYGSSTIPWQSYLRICTVAPVPPEIAITFAPHQTVSHGQRRALACGSCRHHLPCAHVVDRGLQPNARFRAHLHANAPAHHQADHSSIAIHGEKGGLGIDHGLKSDPIRLRLYTSRSYPSKLIRSLHNFVRSSCVDKNYPRL